MKVLHFADAHIDMANYGRHDAASGLPVRVLDFLRSLDEIVDTAIGERVDLVIFAGDTYRDRTPAPTFQREWGKRIMRLSQAGIPTLLLVGNHDLSPAAGRAHAMQEFETLQVPGVRVISRPQLLKPEELGLPVQVIGIPWVSRSSLMANIDEPAEIYNELGDRLGQLFEMFMQQVDPTLPVILTAHASVQGARFGGERMVMLGNDLVLPGSMVRDPRLDYVALGHIHKPQDLNENAHPPVIYPGSIERIDFGEAEDDKFFIVAEVGRGKTDVSWRKLEHVRPFITRYVNLQSGVNATETLKNSLPAPKKMEGAIVRLIVDYPRDLERLIDEAAIREAASPALEFHLLKRPQMDARVRLPNDQSIASLTPLDLLEKYWETLHTPPEEQEALQALARQVLTDQPQE